METVRMINEMGRRARAGEPGVDAYLQRVAADPVTEWFTELLREKSAELERERQRTDQLANALRMWHAARIDGAECPTEADVELIGVLRAMGIIVP
jgi:hypothetical protein